MSVFEGKRSFKRSPYHYDARYGTREHLDDMTWQRGVLSKEVDTMVIGQREAIIAQKLQESSTELEPDKKIIPGEGQISIDEIMFEP